MQYKNLFFPCFITYTREHRSRYESRFPNFDEARDYSSFLFTRRFLFFFSPKHKSGSRFSMKLFSKKIVIIDVKKDEYLGGISS